MIHSYDIKNSLDFFRKLLDEREDFLKNPASARYAINFAVTAWQLNEWVYAERDKYTFMSQFMSKSDFTKYLYSKEPYFRTIHDLADGSKHYQLTNRDTTILDTYVSNWKSVNKVRQVSDVTPQLFLTMKFHDVGMRMAFHDLSYMITIFWHHFFKDDLKEDLNELFNPYTWF